MKTLFQSIYDELKEKALVQFHTTGVLPSQSIAITKDLMKANFDRSKGLIPAGLLGIANKGYAVVPNAIREGLIIAVFMTNFLLISKHELYGVQPDFFDLDRKNLLWFELNSRIIMIREAYYAHYDKIPTELELIPRKIFDKNIESSIEEIFKLNS